MAAADPGFSADEGDGLWAYPLRRFLLTILTLLGISVIIFVLLRVVPGNIVDILFDATGFVNPADKARLEAELGLDKSFTRPRSEPDLPEWLGTACPAPLLKTGKMRSSARNWPANVPRKCLTKPNWMRFYLTWAGC